MDFQITKITNLKPLEKCMKHHLTILESKIHKDGMIRYPIIADRNTGTILDGSHRYCFLLKNGFEFAPVLWVDYNSDDIQVGTNLIERFTHAYSLSKADCISRAETGDLLNPRTTRHFFPFVKSQHPISLKELKLLGMSKHDQKMFNSIVYNYSLEEEINEIKKYVDELRLEKRFIFNYLSDLSKTEEYLEGVIQDLRAVGPVAFFPGKFHPPHLGHLMTIMKIKSDYSEFIIGVTEDLPDNYLTKPSIIFDFLTEFFKESENVRVVYIKGKLTDKLEVGGLPHFDYVLSGNPDVISWAEGLNLKTVFIARSQFDGFSGSEIRSTLKGVDFHEFK